MERVAIIIKKLQQLLDDNASADIILAISQMLVDELQQMQQPNNLGGVTVILPKKSQLLDGVKQEEQPEVTNPTFVEELSLDINEPPLLREESTIESVDETKESNIVIFPIEESTIVEQTREEYFLSLPLSEHEKVIISPEVYPPHIDIDSRDSLFDKSIHPLPLQPKTDTSKLEINEILAKEKNELNSYLSEHKIEVAHLHENTHIKDLKRAISINEKYLFINHLFGGNENLYDKSIRHIQNFTILPEATFWIQKELKTKLNWPDNDDTVELFNQFVRRRFS